MLRKRSLPRTATPRRHAHGKNAAPATKTARAAASRPTKIAPPAPIDVETKVQPPAAKRQDVLHAAWTLFAARGFEHTSMRDLAHEARVSTTTIYAYFPTKRDLLEVLIEERWQQVLIAMLDRSANESDPLERLLMSLIDLNSSIAADPLLSKLLVMPRRVGDAYIHERIAAVQEMMDARCAEAIRLAIESGRLACEDPDALAVLIRVSMLGWLVTESQRRNPMNEQRVTAVLASLIRRSSPAAGGAAAKH